MAILHDSAALSPTYLPFRPLLLLAAPPRRLALPAPKIAGYLSAPKHCAAGAPMCDTTVRVGGDAAQPSVILDRQHEKTRRVVRLEVARTPENQARMADSFEDFLRSLGHWLTMDDAYAVIEKHNRAYEERRAKREAENARYMAALNDWWDQYLAAPNNKARQALIDARPSMLQAAEASA